MKTNNKIKFIVIDLFCGAGGTTTGFENTDIAKVIACVNHDKNAIKSHLLNHPDCKHFEEDILFLNLDVLQQYVDKAKLLYPNAKLILWASLECTNFSDAKGGKPRDEDSRTLAHGLYRYIAKLNPDYIQIENVREFMSWGPLNSDGKPESRTKGRDWIRWKEYICDNFGYKDEWRLLNSADFGAYTSRERLFGIFAKPGLPIKFPKQTHSKSSSKDNLFSNFNDWKKVKDVLELENEGNSIFTRKKPLVDKTYKRILAGVLKQVVGVGDKEFMVKYNSTGKDGNLDSSVFPTSIPCHTIACQDRIGVASVTFIDKYYSGQEENRSQSIENTIGTLTCIDHHSKITCLMRYHGSEDNVLSTEVPSPTLTTKDTVAKLSFIFNPAYGGCSHSIERPCCVIVARQDKAPLYLITAKIGNYKVPVYDTDSEIVVQLKQIMAEYGIVDIKQRMLTISEKLKIQGFPVNYKLFGNQEEQGKFIGNSVTPIIPEMWAVELSQYF